ncbi:MAG: alpha/beta fold hydrolase [Aeromicrobium sp.]
MKRIICAALATAAVVGALAGSAADAATDDGAAPSAAADFTVSTLHFKVRVGPDGANECDIVGDVYRPAGTTSEAPAPAVLTTNGFMGSKDSNKPFAEFLAARGYVVLSYSGLGFGGSTCRISLDDPAWDGAAASQLVSFLGGAAGIGFADKAHAEPARAIDYVVRDETARDGTKYPNDVRVGMVGASYGGAVQLAAASVDHRIDAIVPIATWNDLAQVLTPNHADSDGPTTPRPAGPVKSVTSLGLLASSVLTGISNAADDPFRVTGCPNLPTAICAGMVSALATGSVDATTKSRLSRISPVGYLSRVDAPTLLMQGQDDILFNLSQAQANYDMLRSTGAPVSMIWFSGGHSGPPSPDDYSLDHPSMDQYPIARMANWFDHYLKDSDLEPAPSFAYYRPWVDSRSSRAHYASPVGTSSVTYRLSGSQRLVSGTTAARRGAQSLLAGLGLPTSAGPVDLITDATGVQPDITLPGTAAQWSSDPLATAMDVVGSPRLSVKVQHIGLNLPPTSVQTALFVKLWDVDTAGRRSLVRRMVAPAMVIDPGKTLRVTMPAIVYRFAKGHRVQLEVTGGDANFRGPLNPSLVTIASDDDQVLKLPTPAAASLPGKS